MMGTMTMTMTMATMTTMKMMMMTTMMMTAMMIMMAIMFYLFPSRAVTSLRAQGLELYRPGGAASAAQQSGPNRMASAARCGSGLGRREQCSGNYAPARVPRNAKGPRR